MGKKTGPNPTDRAKKGVKRSLLTEASGVPIGLAIDGANRHDSKMVQVTIESIPVQRPEATEQEPQGMPLDKAYDSGEVRELVKEFGYTAHIRGRGEEAQAIKHEAGFKARRWVVERTALVKRTSDHCKTAEFPMKACWKEDAQIVAGEPQKKRPLKPLYDS